MSTRTNNSQKGRRFNTRKSLAAKAALARAYGHAEPQTTIERIAATMRVSWRAFKAHISADAEFVGRKANAGLEVIGGAAMAAAFLLYRPIGCAVLNVRDWVHGNVVAFVVNIQDGLGV